MRTNMTNDNIKEENGKKIKIPTLHSPREKEVLKIRFNKEPDTQKTLNQVGKDFNITRERIRQIEKKALKKLKVNLPDDVA